MGRWEEGQSECTMTATVRDEHLGRYEYEYESDSASAYPGAALGPYCPGVRRRR